MKASTKRSSFKIIKWQKTKTDEGTLYSYVSDETRTCLIKNDETIEIRVNGLLSHYPSETEIAVMRNIKEVLEKIQTAHFCAGTQEGYNCPNVLFPVSGRSTSLCIRCPHCRVLRRRQRNTLSARNIRHSLARIDTNEKTCVVEGCPGRDNIKIRLYPIPLGDIEAWCANLKLDISEVNEDTRVCSRHFEESCKRPLTLKGGARPTLNLGHTDDIPYPIKKIHQHKFCCCIVGCHVAYPPHRLHRFPTEEDRLKQWLLICVIKDDHKLRKQKFICSKHFDESMFNGKGLKKNAVPKMDAHSWLKNNTNVDVLETISFDEKIIPPTRRVDLEPEVEALCEIQNALTSKAEICEDNDTGDDNDSDGQDALQCKSVCITCAKAFKDCETYRRGCYDLEKQLEMLQAKTEELRIQNEILLTEMDSNYIVYQEDQ